MDPKDEEIKALKEQVAVLTTQVEEKDGSIATLTKELETTKATIVEKDRVIELKNQDIVSIRRHGQKLKELTDAEKETLSAKEIELHEATLRLQKEQEEFQNQQKETLKKEKDARVERALKGVAGSDAAYSEKVRNNLARITDFEKAQTEEEITKLVNEAAGMVPEPRPNPITKVLSSADGAAFDGSASESFADTAEGAALAKSLGIVITPPGTPAPATPAPITNPNAQ